MDRKLIMKLHRELQIPIKRCKELLSVYDYENAKRSFNGERAFVGSLHAARDDYKGSVLYTPLGAKALPFNVTQEELNLPAVQADIRNGLVVIKGEIVEELEPVELPSEDDLFRKEVNEIVDFLEPLVKSSTVIEMIVHTRDLKKMIEAIRNPPSTGGGLA